MIHVLTHNGQLPKDGGLRIGYFTTNQEGCVTGVFPLGWNQIIVKAPPKPKPKIVYGNMVREYYGECGSCYCDLGHYGNTVTVDTDEGKKSVKKCPSCGKLNRPSLSLS